MVKMMQSVGRPWLPQNQSKAAYLWIFSLAFLLWKYVYVKPGALELAALLLTVILFLPVYFYSFWARQTRALLCVLLTCLLGVLWAPHNVGASCFFIFAGAMCASIERPRHAYAALALVTAIACSVALTAPIEFSIPTLVAGVPIGIASIMEANLRRSRDQLLRKQEEVEHMATIAERERISRDLHDLLGHTLSMITLKAELAGKLLERDVGACRREIADIETSARNALAEVRSAVTGYRETGFAHEVATAHATLAAAAVSLELRIEPVALPAAVENVMALALREAVTNIVRHAAATHCDVSLALSNGLIVLRIANNGSALAPRHTVEHGNGLAGMRERIMALGGKLTIQVERGLALELSLPMGQSA